MGIPARLATLRFGGQEGQAVREHAKHRKDLVTTNQRPSNGGRWGLSGRFITEKSNVEVFTVGENHRSTGHQGSANLGGAHRAAGVATHLSVAGWGESPGPFIVLWFTTHNPSLHLTGYGGGPCCFCGFVWLHRLSCSLSAVR